MVTTFCQKKTQIIDISETPLQDTPRGSCECQLSPPIDEYTYCVLKGICRKILKEIYREQRREVYSIFDGGNSMTYETIGTQKSEFLQSRKDSSFLSHLSSKHRQLSVSTLKKISRHKKVLQKGKSTTSQKRDKSVFDMKEFQGRKSNKDVHRRSKESDEKLPLVSNLRQKVRHGDGKLVTKGEEGNKGKETQQLSAQKIGQVQENTKVANYNTGRNIDNELDKPRGNRFAKRSKAYIGQTKSGKDKVDPVYLAEKLKYDQGLTGYKRNTVDQKSSNKNKFSQYRAGRNASVQELFERANKNSADKERGEKNSQFDKRQSIEKTMVAKNQLRSRQTIQDLKQSHMAVVSKSRVSPTNYKRNPKINEGPSELHNKVSAARRQGVPEIGAHPQSGQERGIHMKPLGAHTMVMQGVLKPNQPKQGLHAKNVKERHVHRRYDMPDIKGPSTSQTASNNLYLERDILSQKRKQLRSLDQMAKPFQYPCTTSRSKVVFLSRVDAVRPCDFLRAKMEDREMCNQNICQPYTSIPRPPKSCLSQPDPCQSSFVRCVC